MTDSPLYGSVKPYTQHLAICTGGPPELWASRVEEMEGLFAALNAALKVRALHSIKLTACDAPSTGAEGFDIFLLPDMLILPEITVDKVDRLADALLRQFEEGLPFDVTPMPGGDHLFICTHANRDDRCGNWGPLFIAAVQAEIERQGAIAYVHQTSHLGGHKYAATGILYPAGVWYGNLRPEDAARFVDEQLNQEMLLPEFYRGRMSASEVQQSAEAIAVLALRQQFDSYESVVVSLTERTAEATAHAEATVIQGGARRRLSATFDLEWNQYWFAPLEPQFDEV